jgi:hypothetical protein
MRLNFIIMRGRIYEMNQKDIGVVAHEIEIIFPEVIRTGDDGMKVLNIRHL